MSKPSTSLSKQQTSPSEQSTFLFVNETSDAPSYKSGNRSEIRAHVRKVAAKQFGLTHKVPKKRAERLPKYAPLTAKGLETDTSKDSEHHQHCPKGVPETAQIPSTHSGPSTLARSLIEITELSESLPVLTGSESQAPIERLERSASYCHACGQPINRPGHKQKQIWTLKDTTLVPRKSKWIKPHPVGPFGAGRIDPFSSLPMDEKSSYSQELLDHGT